MKTEERHEKTRYMGEALGFCEVSIRLTYYFLERRDGCTKEEAGCAKKESTARERRIWSIVSLLDTSANVSRMAFGFDSTCEISGLLMTGK